MYPSAHNAKRVLNVFLHSLPNPAPKSRFFPDYNQYSVGETTMTSYGQFTIQSAAAVALLVFDRTATAMPSELVAQ